MGTLCQSGAVMFKAGANAPSITGLQMSGAILQAESQIVVDSEYNWIDVYGTLNADVKYILEAACSAKAGLIVINYDPDAIGRSTAVSKQNVLAWEYNIAIKQLKEQSKRGFIQNA